MADEATTGSRWLRIAKDAATVVAVIMAGFALFQSCEANKTSSEGLDFAKADAAHQRLSLAIEDAVSKLDRPVELGSAIERARRSRNDGRVLLGEERWEAARRTFDDALVQLAGACETAGVGCDVTFELREQLRP